MRSLKLPRGGSCLHCGLTWVDNDTLMLQSAIDHLYNGNVFWTHILSVAYLFKFFPQLMVNNPPIPPVSYLIFRLLLTEMNGSSLLAQYIQGDQTICMMNGWDPARLHTPLCLIVHGAINRETHRFLALQTTQPAAFSRKWGYMFCYFNKVVHTRTHAHKQTHTRRL